MTKAGKAILLICYCGLYAMSLAGFVVANREARMHREECSPTKWYLRMTAFLAISMSELWFCVYISSV